MTKYIISHIDPQSKSSFIMDGRQLKYFFHINHAIHYVDTLYKGLLDSGCTVTKKTNPENLFNLVLKKDAIVCSFELTAVDQTWIYNIVEIIDDTTVAPYEDFVDKRGRPWEWFIDLAYYDMICVRVKGERDFNSPLSFHFNTTDQAQQFVELLVVSS